MIILSDEKNEGDSLLCTSMHFSGRAPSELSSLDLLHLSFIHTQFPSMQHPRSFLLQHLPEGWLGLGEHEQGSSSGVYGSPPSREHTTCHTPNYPQVYLPSGSVSLGQCEHKCAIYGNREILLPLQCAHTTSLRYGGVPRSFEALRL